MDREGRNESGPLPPEMGTTVPKDVLVDRAEAARLLEVTPDRVDVMVDQRMLEPVSSGNDGPRFRVADVEAVRLLGA